MTTIYVRILEKVEEVPEILEIKGTVKNVKLEVINIK